MHDNYKDFSLPLLEIDWHCPDNVKDLGEHRDVVTSVSWSPSGHQLASASDDGRIRVWKMPSGKEKYKWDVGSAITSLSWSPDGMQLACATKDRTVLVWDEASGRQINVLRGHKNIINAVAWSPDGNHIASASSDKTLRIWDPISGTETRAINGVTGIFTCVCWNLDSTKLMSGDGIGSIQLWNILTGTEERQIGAHESRVTSLSLNTQGTLLASASKDKTVRIWNLDNPDQNALVLQEHQNSVNTVAWSPSGSDLATGSSDHAILIWDWSSTNEDSKLPEPVKLNHDGKTVFALDWNFTGTVLASGSKDHKVRTIQPTLLKVKDIPISGGHKLTCSKARAFGHAAIAWKAGDVRESWSIIAKLCNASWVFEVIDMLGFKHEHDLIEQRDNHERSRLIRAAIEKKLSEESVSKTASLNDSIAVLKRFLSETTDEQSLDWLRETVKHTIERQQDTEQPLRVALLGEFSSGKSRLINALLGEQILSTGIVPVTRSVTRIVHSSELSLRVRYIDGSEDEISVDELKMYTDERKRSEGENTVTEVILGHPSPMLKNVELWDTPGFNSSNQLHDEVAAQLLVEADAVLWILSSYQVGSRSESNLLETVRRAQGKVVAVLNQIDRLNSESDINNQLSEVKKHCGDSVEEVVPTSAKWIEEENPNGNRDDLMERIEHIGSWSQNRRLARTVRRVAAVADQVRACLFLRDSENKQIKQLRREVLREAKGQRAAAITLWREAKDHHAHIHGKKWSKTNSSDSWFASRCAERTPLTLAYRALLHKDFPTDGYDAFLQCLRTLEEVHLHVTPHGPVPWRDDFLVAWQKGRDVNPPKPLTYVFADRTPKYGESQRWLMQLLSIRGLDFPKRWTGMVGHDSQINEILNTLRKIPSDSEIRGWWKSLDETVLEQEQPSRPSWRKRLETVLELPPGRRCQTWIDQEEKVFELVRTHQPLVGVWLRAQTAAEKAGDDFDQDTQRLLENHQNRCNTLEKNIQELSEGIGSEVNAFDKHAMKTELSIRTTIGKLEKQITILEAEATIPPPIEFTSLLSELKSRRNKYSNELAPCPLENKIVTAGIVGYFVKRGIGWFLLIWCAVSIIGSKFMTSLFLLCSPFVAIWWIKKVKRQLQQSFSNINAELSSLRLRKHFQIEGLKDQQETLNHEKQAIKKKEEDAIVQLQIWQTEITFTKDNPPNPEDLPSFQVYQTSLVNLEKCEREATAQKREFMDNLRMLFPKNKSILQHF